MNYTEIDVQIVNNCLGLTIKSIDFFEIHMQEYILCLLFGLILKLILSSLNTS